MWFSKPKYQKVLSNLSTNEAIAALQCLTDNFHCEKNKFYHDNEYYGLYNSQIDKVCGQGFSKLSQEEKQDVIKILSSKVRSKKYLLIPILAIIVGVPISWNLAKFLHWIGI
jgi:hypothetical protein